MEVKFRHSETAKKHKVKEAVGDFYILESTPSNWSSDCFVAVRKSAVDVVKERTYQIGQYFIAGGTKCILAQVGKSEVVLINLSNGNRLLDPKEVKSVSRITQEELNRLSTYNVTPTPWEDEHAIE